QDEKLEDAPFERIDPDGKSWVAAWRGVHGARPEKAASGLSAGAGKRTTRGAKRSSSGGVSVPMSGDQFAVAKRTTPAILRGEGVQFARRFLQRGVSSLGFCPQGAEPSFRFAKRLNAD